MNRPGLLAATSAILFSALFSTSAAYGWRETGHWTVCEIASRHLTQRAAFELGTLLDGRDFAANCTWPDMVRKSSDPTLRRTYDWHFINLDDGQRYFDPSTINPKCDILRALLEAQSALNDRNRPVAHRLRALRFLGHFAGDSHQPLHVGRKSDLGGNNVKVSWFGSPKYTSTEILRVDLPPGGSCVGDGLVVDQPTGECVRANVSQEQATLHKAWDLLFLDRYIERQGLVAEAGDSKYRHKAYATSLDHDVTEEEQRRWQRASLLAWAEESLAYRSQTYDGLEGSPSVVVPLSHDYYERHISYLNRRILMAGYRLAGVLNRALDSDYDRTLVRTFMGIELEEILARLRRVVPGGVVECPAE